MLPRRRVIATRKRTTIVPCGKSRFLSFLPSPAVLEGAPRVGPIFPASVWTAQGTSTHAGCAGQDTSPSRRPPLFKQHTAVWLKGRLSSTGGVLPVLGARSGKISAEGGALPLWTIRYNATAKTSSKTRLSKTHLTARPQKLLLSPVTLTTCPRTMLPAGARTMLPAARATEVALVGVQFI